MLSETTKMLLALGVPVLITAALFYVFTRPAAPVKNSGGKNVSPEAAAAVVVAAQMDRGTDDGRKADNF